MTIDLKSGVNPAYVPENIYATYLKSNPKEREIDAYANIFFPGIKKTKDKNQTAYQGYISSRRGESKNPTNIANEER